MPPVLYLIVPCYNEQEVLPVTGKMFRDKLKELINAEKIAENSRVLFVDDGSRDNTWNIILRLSNECGLVCGIRQSRNRGHQNALLAGLMEARGRCDITVSIDCDGQDDINAIDLMLKEYAEGCEIVYGVRSDRKSDTAFKRGSAQGYYKFLKLLGAQVVYNHADYRLVSARALNAFADFKEVNLFLRGMFPLVGFKSSSVPYSRSERLAGKSHYPLRKMLALAFDGITSLSIQPLRLIMGLGGIIAALSFIGVIWSVITELCGKAVAGWASMTSIICFIGGIQLICTGILGEYIGKIYLEVKHRPRYIIEEKTENLGEERK